jgi:hypothetical protein
MTSRRTKGRPPRRPGALELRWPWQAGRGEGYLLQSLHPWRNLVGAATARVRGRSPRRDASLHRHRARPSSPHRARPSSYATSSPVAAALGDSGKSRHHRMGHIGFVIRCCRAAGRHIRHRSRLRTAESLEKPWMPYKSDCLPSVRLEIRVTLGRVDVLAMHTWCPHSGQRYS